MAEIDKFELMEIKTKKQAEELARLKKAKKRNYIVGLSITGVLIIGLIVIYALACNIWLVNISNLPYIQYSYDANSSNPTVTITRLTPSSDYPENFIIPDEIDGMPVTAIGDSAFVDCDRLESVTMPQTITSIGEYAFANCTNLSEITFSDNIETLGTGAFQNTAFLENLSDDSITIISSILFKVGDNIVTDNTIILNDHDSVVPQEYTTGDYNIVYFSDYFSDDVEEISVWSDALFSDMEGLVYIELPQYLETIPINTFNGCINLEGIDLPESVTSINDYAFNGCVNLEDITIGETVTTIGEYAFANTGISDLDLPSSMTSIGQHAFENCENIVSFNWPSNLTSIPNYAFNGCTNLSEFNFLGDSFELVTSIGTNAFAGTAITSFDLPINLSVISSNLFNGSKLETIRVYEGSVSYDKHGTTITTGIIRIDAGAFDGCELESFILYDENYNSVSPEGEITLPTTLSSVAVSSSSGSTFSNNNSMTKITLPYSLRSTSYMMFTNNSALKEVNFQIKRSGTSYEGITTIAYETFYNCTSIETLEIPNTVTSIEDGAFGYMTSLKTITLPDETSTFRTIPSYLFDNCISLESVNISENVYTFRSYAFRACYSLEYVYIPFDSSPSQLTIQADTFTDCREANEDGTYDEQMPIYLNVSEDEISSLRVADGWYDDSCVVYWANEWEMVDGEPTPTVEK